MAFEDCYYDKRNLQKSAGIKMSKSFPLSGTSLASLESLSLPLVCSFEPWVLKWAWISIYIVFNGDCFVENRCKRLFFQQTCNVKLARRELLKLLQKWMVSLFLYHFCSVEIRRYHLWLYVLHMIVKLLIDSNALY